MRQSAGLRTERRTANCVEPAESRLGLRNTQKAKQTTGAEVSLSPSVSLSDTQTQTHRENTPSAPPLCSRTGTRRQGGSRPS